MKPETEPFSADEIHWIACEFSHDIRCAVDPKDGLERIRWNNRFAMRALVTITAAESALARARYEALESACTTIAKLRKTPEMAAHKRALEKAESAIRALAKGAS